MRPETFRVFAYGTLCSDQPEHQRYCLSAISIEKAQIPGKLFQLKEGYPILNIAPTNVMLKASDNPILDWESADGLNSQSIDEEPSHVAGELMTFRLDSPILAALDRWECFSPGSDSTYQRIITKAKNASDQWLQCWTYASLAPPPNAKQINATRWQRPAFL